VVGIRAITPLWSDNVRLWEWASRSYPSSSYATDLLLSAYVNAGEISKARAIGDRLLAEKTQCINCLLNESSAAISSGDIDTATRALDLLQTVPALATDKSSFESYLSTRGNISLIKNRLTEAERLLRAASNLDPLDAKTKYNLAITLGLLGNAEEARSIGQKALVLLPATGREKRRQTLEEVITKGQSLLPTKINDDHGKPSR
jgi:tetratricopeptide (TPR) repeat protein